MKPLVINPLCGPRYLVGKGIIKEMDSDNMYIATKAQVRRAVNLKPGSPAVDVFVYVGRIKRCFRWTTRARRTPRSVHIGCQVFSGRNFDALLRWANS